MVGGGNGFGNGGAVYGNGAGSGAGGGSGKGREAQRANYLAEHFSYIKKIIHEKLVYPPKARREGWTGKVRVSFVILENGNVSDIRVLAGSGHELLDQNAVETIKKAAPFPRPPIRAELRMPIIYRLDQ